ncbi:hypothetical protein JCM5350_006648 [Sporobolomyces pararoseus]
MEYLDQYVALPSQQPSFQLQPPTPISSTGPQSTFVIPSTSSPVAIPPSSRPSSRGGAGTTASSLSRSSSRHHPYGASPASFASSFSERSFRPRSATSASDRSEWDSEASTYETDCESRYNNSPETVDFSSLDFPFLSDATLPQPPLSSSYPSSSQPSPESPAVRAPSKPAKNVKPKKSHARKTAPGHIKRPPNAFILFRSHCCGPKGDASEPDPPGTAHARHLASLDINNSQHVSLIVSQIWKGMKPEDKAYWEQKAQAAKEEHQRLYPEYRYKPQPRAKETIRKRKKADPVESREHRDACHEVARIVLEQEGDELPQEQPADFQLEPRFQLPVPPPSASGRGRANLMEEVLDGGASRRTSPKSKTTRRATRKTKSKEPVSDDSSPPSLGLPTPPALYEPFSRPTTSPYPSVLAGVERAQYHDQFGPRSSPDYDHSPFAFMAQLEQDASKSTLPPNALFGIDPQYGLLSSTVDGQALHPLSRPSTTSSPSTFHSSPSAPAPPATAIGFSRPPSPTSDAIRQMQSYSLNGPSPPSRSPASLPSLPTQPPSNGSEYSFGSYSSQPETQGVAPLAQRRDIQFPPNLPLSALKHRRSTLRPGQHVEPNGRGDLMLISPLTSTFNGRRQSVGWSSGLRRVSLGLSGGGVDENNGAIPYRKSSLSVGVLANDPSFETLTFPQDVLESFPVENPFTDADFLAAFGSSTLPVTEDEVEYERPNTASSSWSTDDSIENIERLEGGFPAGYFDRRRSTLVASKLSPPQARSPEYHVESTQFFSPPEHPLSSFGSQPSQPAVPAFGSAEFGGSFQPFAHRQSIGTLLASSLSAFNQNVTPTFQSDDASSQFTREGGQQQQWDSASMKDTALSILQERRNPIGASLQEAQPSSECEYVLLPFEQLGDTELMTKLHEQGYGIAFETAPLNDYPQSQAHGAIPSGATMAVDDSHIFAHSSHQ